jgi:hypothetical protein
MRFVKLILILSGLLFSGYLFAQENTTPAVPFLNIPIDARAAGMGDTGVATHADVNSARWNPAKLVWLGNSAEFGIAYTPYLANIADDVSLLGANYAQRINDVSALAVGLTYFGLGEVEFRQTIDETPQIVKPNELALDFAYGLQLNDQLSVGAGLRFISSNLKLTEAVQDARAANALAVDVGFYYRSDLNIREGADSRWRAGLSLSNFGTTLSYDLDGIEQYLPSTLRMGLGHDFIFDYDSTLSVTLEANRLVVPVDNKALGFALGSEYNFRDDLFLRLGYYHDTTDITNRKYATVGAGTRKDNLKIDLSYLFSTSQVQNPFENALRIALSFEFGDRFYNF